MSKPFKPKAHPYDAAREQLKEAGGGLFGVTLYTPLDGQQNGDKNRANSYTWLEVGFPGSRYIRVAYDTGWIVNVPVESEEELHRLAQVFMDLMNSKT